MLEFFPKPEVLTLLSFNSSSNIVYDFCWIYYSALSDKENICNPW